MSSRGRRRIDEIGDESRRRILDAAEELFAERGFDRTSFVDISELSGISRGSIPWHFKNKDGLVMAVVERAMDRFMGPEKYDYDNPPTMAEVLLDYATWVRTGNSALLFMVITEAMSSTGAIHSQYQDFVGQRRKGVERWLRTHRPEGIDPDFAAERERSFAVALNGAAMGIHLQAVIDPERIDLDAAMAALALLVDNYLEAVWVTDPSAAPAAPAPRNGAKKRTASSARKSSD